MPDADFPAQSLTQKIKLLTKSDIAHPGPAPTEFIIAAPVSPNNNVGQKIFQHMKTTIALLGLLLLCGCTRDPAVERIEKSLSDFQQDLGAFRYIGHTPQIKIKILQREIVPGDEKKFERPKLKVTGVMQQEGDFPVSRYNAQVNIQISIDGKKVGDATISGVVENKTAAFSQDLFLGSLAYDASPALSTIDIEITSFGWWPKEQAGKVTLEISK